jgi:tripartite-type tricarboxylate transporter receptor subunit TctC
MQRRTFCLGALGAGLAFRSLLAQAAETYPSRAVRIVVPYAAGGGPDIMVRQFGPRLSKAMGQPIVVENKVGAGGVGSGAHLGGATFVSLLKADAVHIPFKGSVEIPVSLTRGDTDFAFTIAGTAIPQVQSGQLRALAVTSAEPLAELPGVPPLHELLHSDLAIQEFWFSFWLPRNAPGAVVDTLYRATAVALRDPEVKTLFEAAGNRVIRSDSPQAAADFVRSEQRKWEEIIKLTGVTAG